LATTCQRDRRSDLSNGIPSTDTFTQQGVFFSRHVTNQRWVWAPHDDGVGQLVYGGIMYNRHLRPGERYW